MNRTWSFYDDVTGLFSASRVTCSDADLAANTPAGHTALEGVYDRLSQMVDIEGASQEVVDYIPDAPADDSLQTWSWDTGTKRWVATPTLLANKNARKVPIQAAIDAIELSDSHARSLREVLLAVVASTTPPSASVTVLSDADADIQALRDVMDDIDAAADQEELDGIVWP